MRLPLGQKLIHQSYEPRIVRWFEQMNHLVDDDIFQGIRSAFWRDQYSAEGSLPVHCSYPISSSFFERRIAAQ